MSAKVEPVQKCSFDNLTLSNSYQQRKVLDVVNFILTNAGKHRFYLKESDCRNISCLVHNFELCK